MQNPEALLPAGFGNQTKKKRAARIIDDDEVGIDVVAASKSSSGGVDVLLTPCAFGQALGHESRIFCDWPDLHFL